MPPGEGSLYGQKASWRGAQASVPLLDLSCLAFIAYTLSLWVLRDGEKVKFIEKNVGITYTMAIVYITVPLPDELLHESQILLSMSLIDNIRRT